MPTGNPKPFHCLACGHRVVFTGKINLHCSKCGVMLTAGEPGQRGKLGPILIIAGLVAILVIALYLIVK